MLFSIVSFLGGTFVVASELVRNRYPDIKYVIEHTHESTEVQVQ